MVRSVKTPLKKVIGTAKLTYEEMNTALIEIEGIINTRPLTYLHDNDISEPLTPSHLLIGHDLNVSNEAESSSVISNAESMSNRYNYLQSTNGVGSGVGQIPPPLPNRIARTSYV